MADYTLSVDITANDNASKTFQQIQENAKNFKSRKRQESLSRS